MAKANLPCEEEVPKSWGNARHWSVMNRHVQALATSSPSADKCSNLQFNAMTAHTKEFHTSHFQA